MYYCCIARIHLYYLNYVAETGIVEVKYIFRKQLPTSLTPPAETSAQARKQ